MDNTIQDIILMIEDCESDEKKKAMIDGVFSGIEVAREMIQWKVFVIGGNTIGRIRSKPVITTREVLRQVLNEDYWLRNQGKRFETLDTVKRLPETEELKEIYLNGFYRGLLYALDFAQVLKSGHSYELAVERGMMWTVIVRTYLENL